MKITVNAIEIDVIGHTRISYEDVLKFAGQPVGASVVYSGPRKGDARREGTLFAGKSIDLEDGMHFSAVRTNNA